MDEQYCQERNRFIPYALKIANQKVGERYPKGSTIAEREIWYIKWNHTYFAEMDRLWQEWLLAKPRYERRAEESKGMKMAEWIRTHFERIARHLGLSIEEIEQEGQEATA